jgi:tetratricopeptide (TPR) repeat protein
MRSLLPLLLLLAGVCAAVPGPSRQATPLAGAEVYWRTLAAVAWIQAADRGKGTGWVVDARRRWLVTCYHVVGENDTCEVVFPWREKSSVLGPRRLYLEHMPELRKRGLAVRGRVLRRNRDTDLALVQLEHLPPGVRALGLAASAVPGDRVHLVGNRFDLDVLWGHATGTVRARRTLRDGYFHAGRQLAKGARMLLASVPINEGDSGGPLVNDTGEVVGVTAAVAWEVHGAGLFIELDEVRVLLELPPPSTPPSDEERTGRAVYRRAMRSVALVQYTGGTRFAGVLVDRSRRLVLTTAEAVAKEETVEVAFPVEQPAGVVVEAAYYRDRSALLRRKGAVSTGVVLAVDPRRNLALIEAGALPAGTSELALAKARPAPGDALHLISHPQRLEVLWVYSTAGVRQVDRFRLAPEIEGPDPAVLIVQAALAAGEGGGPVLDDRGELVGVVSGKIGAQQQIVYVLDLSEVRDFLTAIRPRAEPRTPAEHVERGALFVRAREYDLALASYSAALALDRRAAAAWAGRAWVHSLRGAHDRALADADRALRIDGRPVEAYCRRAAAWCGRGEAERAMRDCDTALRLDPRCALAFALRGQAHLLRNNADRAIADADEAIWLDSRLALACRVRGAAWSRKNDTARALVDFTRAVLLDPHAAEGFVMRGELHWRRGDTDAALADFTQALKLAPGDPAALLGRALARSARGEYDEALADLDALIERFPERFAARVDRGSERLRRGHYRTGVADLLDAARAKPVLIERILGEVERRTMDPRTLVEQSAGAGVCRDVLQGIAPLLRDWPVLRNQIAEALTAASGETNVGKRLELLRAAVSAVRAGLSER